MLFCYFRFAGNWSLLKNLSGGDFGEEFLLSSCATVEDSVLQAGAAITLCQADGSMFPRFNSRIALNTTRFTPAIVNRK